jgi:hypothetical protein
MLDALARERKITNAPVPVPNADPSFFMLRLILSVVLSIALWAALLYGVWLTYFLPMFPKMPGMLQVLVCAIPFSVFAYCSGLFGMTQSFVSRKLGIEDFWHED